MLEVKSIQWLEQIENKFLILGRNKSYIVTIRPSLAALMGWHGLVPRAVTE